MFLTYPNMNSTKNLYVNPIIWLGYFVGWRVGEISPLFAKPFPNVSPFHNSCYIFVFLVLPTVLNLTNHPLPQQPIPPHNLTQLERWSAGTGGGRVAPGKLLGEKISKNSPLWNVLWIFEEYWQQFVEKLQQPTLKAIFSSDCTQFLSNSISCKLTGGTQNKNINWVHLNFKPINNSINFVLIVCNKMRFFWQNYQSVFYFHRAQS